MGNKTYLLIGGVVLIIIVLLVVFKDKLGGGAQLKTTDDGTGSGSDSETGGNTGAGSGYVPIIADAVGSGTGGTSAGTEPVITSIQAYFKTGKPLYKPNEWRNVTPQVTDYVNSHDGKIDIKNPTYLQSWIKKLNFPLTWGILVPIGPLWWTIQTPSARIKFVYTTNLNPVPVVREFSSTQRLLIP